MRARSVLSLVFVAAVAWSGSALAEPTRSGDFEPGGTAPRGTHGLAAGLDGSDPNACRFCHPDLDRGGDSSSAATAMCLGCHDGAMASDVAANMPLAGVVPVAASGGGSDHPVGIPMTLFSGEIVRFGGQLAGFNQDVANGRPVWWIDTEDVPNGRRDQSDVIFYTRRQGGRDLPFIECATCHDPHAEENQGRLRTSNFGSKLCRACHDV